MIWWGIYPENNIITNEFVSNLRDTLLEDQELEEKIDLVFEKLNEFYDYCLDNNYEDFYPFIGCVKVLVTEDNIPMTKDIYIKCLIGLLLYEESKEGNVIEESFSDTKDWIKGELKDNDIPELFLKITKIKRINNQGVPDIKDYIQLENNQF